MKFVVIYRTEALGEEMFEEFSSEAEVRSFIDRNSGKENFRFRVIQGREVKFDPVRIA